jgi:opacity protein-like surface antigen
MSRLRLELASIGALACALLAPALAGAQGAPPAAAAPPPAAPPAPPPAPPLDPELLRWIDQRVSAEVEARLTAAEKKRAAAEEKKAEEQKAEEKKAEEKKAAEKKAEEQKAAEKKPEPFAFGDFTWLNGSTRQTKPVLDTPYFTPEFLLDVNYTLSQNNPIDHTVVGTTMLSRNNEVALQFVGFGGDFHYENARARLMTQFGNRATVVPRNDGSTYKGQYDLQTALRYISEAYGGYHIDALNGINVDAGIFMSYVGLFSYDNAENWIYMASYTSDNTPWFFNGVRIQVFTSDKLKIEPWIINGWQTYGKFNEMPGFGAQILYRPVEWLSLLSNDYVGWDTQDAPGRLRFHSDNSALVRYYNKPDNKLFPRAAFSITADIGFESGDGVTPFGGSGREGHCTDATPCTQHFLSWMAYNRFWFFNGVLAFTAGGGMMDNPGRYLVLAPTGQASPFAQPLSTDGVQYVAGSRPFDLNPGTLFDAWDVGAGLQFMPDEIITYDLEFNHRAASVPYFAGHGGVTSPDGYVTTAVPVGWRPDLVKADTRVIAALLARF